MTQPLNLQQLPSPQAQVPIPLPQDPSNLHSGKGSSRIWVDPSRSKQIWACDLSVWSCQCECDLFSVTFSVWPCQCQYDLFSMTLSMSVWPCQCQYDLVNISVTMSVSVWHFQCAELCTPPPIPTGLWLNSKLSESKMSLVWGVWVESKGMS